MVAIKIAFPDVDLTSVIDDRTLRGAPERVCSAVALVTQIDEAAGHYTNVKKAAALATSGYAADIISGYKLNGQAFPLTACDVLVGEPIFTTNSHMRNGLAKQRALLSERTLDACLFAPGARRCRIAVADGAAIAQALTSIQWSRPSTEILLRLRRKKLRLHWGNNRGTRCPELVVSFLMDPARSDPIGAIFARRLHSLRKRLIYGQDGRTEFIRQWSLFRATTDRNNQVKAQAAKDGIKRPQLQRQVGGPMAGLNETLEWLACDLFIDKSAVFIKRDSCSSFQN